MAWSDAELVLKTRAGDREAFGRLVERHRRTVFALALQRGLQDAEADDLAQETFVRAYKNLAHLTDPERFAGWLYGIAANVAADAARSRRRQLNRYVENGAESAASLQEFTEAPAGLGVERGEEEQRVLRALGELPEDQRLVLTLRYLEGLSPKQIAERLNEPRGTVRSRLHHALHFLQTAFGWTART